MPHRDWLIDNIDVRRWYYRDAPPIGSTVRYMDESYIDTVSHVTPFCVWLASGRSMLRPYFVARFIAWTLTPHPRPRYARGLSNSRTRSTQPLRPDMTVLAA